MNPCPCGYLGDPTHECKCTMTQIQNYQRKISGPLLDRIDLFIEVDRVDNKSLLNKLPNDNSEHSVVKNTITEAIQHQRARYGRDDYYNSSLSSYEVSKILALEENAKKLLTTASEKLNLSARAYFKVIKVARTIADIAGAELIGSDHIAEALAYRRK
jgi:magnesium chelatase family protein